MWKFKRLMAIPVVVLCGALVACEPPPPPDGRDLGVVVTFPSAVPPGAPVPFVAQLTNHGTASASGISFSIGATNAASVKFTDTMSLGSCSGYDTSVVTCTIESQPVQPGFTWAIQGTIEFPANGEANVVAGAHSDGTEPTADPHLNYDVVAVSVAPVDTVDLRPVAWSYWPSSNHQVGNTVDSYTTVWVPQSPVVGIAVSQTFPESFQIESAYMGWTEDHPDFSTPSFSGTCTTSGNTVTCTADRTVQWASSLMMRVSVTPTESGTFYVEHTASSDHPEPSPDPNPNTVSNHAIVVDP